MCINVKRVTLKMDTSPFNVRRRTAADNRKKVARKDFSGHFNETCERRGLPDFRREAIYAALKLNAPTMSLLPG